MNTTIVLRISGVENLARVPLSRRLTFTRFLTRLLPSDD